MKTKILSAFFLTLALCAAGFAQSFDKAKLDQFFDALAAKDKAMGSVAVSKDGKIIYSRAVGYGSLDGKDKIAATAATKYRIGSISKMFTAVMIFQLVDEGKLKLTDALDKFYPNVPNAETITIGEMLAHRSGIHNIIDDEEYATYLEKPQTKDEMLARIIKAKSDFAPDAKAEYSNSNYILLGYILEKVGKKSYADALRTRITSKIGLSDTYLGGKIGAQPNEAFSYSYTGKWQPSTETDMSIPGGAGAIVSTPTDLTKFIDALFNLKLISQKSLDQMKTINQGYGMGMFQFPAFDRKGFGHTGGIDDFNSMLVEVPEDKLAVAYISNGMIFPVNDIVIAALAAGLNQPLKIPTFETFAVKAEDLARFTGVYSSPTFPLKITISSENGVLVAQATGQPPLALEAVAANKFKFDAAGVVLEFDAPKNQMTLKQSGREFVLTKEK